MESVIRDEVMEHMMANKLLSEKQYGFVPGRSTVLQLLKVLDDWTYMVDQGIQVDTIFLDFMKAFDRVPHKRLLKKVKGYGVTGYFLGWLQSFLTGRTQQVVVNGAHSEWSPVTSGIPQGSVMGPVLFVIFINDLPTSVKSSIYLFADDTKIFSHIINQSDVSVLQNDLDSLQKWSDTWLLKFHPNKCKVATIGKQKIQSSYHMKDDMGQPIMLDRISEEKDIGVTIDTDLSFEAHIASITSKASQIMGAIRRTFTALDNEHMMMLYKSQVRSILEYANPVWSPYKRKDINLVENVQRRATKNLPGMANLSYPERLSKLKLPTLLYRRLRGDMITTYKILHGIHDKVICPDMHYIGESITQGNSMKLFERRPTGGTNLRKFFFTLRVPRMWNTLPKHVVRSENVRQFEHNLDKFWESVPWKYDHEQWNPM